MKLHTSVNKVIWSYHTKDQVGRLIRSWDMSFQSLGKKSYDEFRHFRKKKSTKLMCEVSRNFRKYNHPNQPTYPKISKSVGLKVFYKIFWNFAWTTIQPLDKSWVSCTAIMRLLCFHVVKNMKFIEVFWYVCQSCTLNNCQWVVWCINITCLHVQNFTHV